MNMCALIKAILHLIFLVAAMIEYFKDNKTDALWYMAWAIVFNV